MTSNIWGTKFKIHGLATLVPANLGQVTYKTSLLHLQPRQMTLVMTELRDDFPIGPDPTFNPNLFSEDEDESAVLEEKSKITRIVSIDSPPIAPMSPRGNRLVKTKPTASYLEAAPQHELAPQHKPPDLLLDVSFCENVRPNRPSTSFAGGQFQRGGSPSGGPQRHAISPLCCEGSVPALQSPKNAVAPCDIIFDRPPAHHQTLITYTGDYNNSGNVQQVKAAVIESPPRSFVKKVDSDANNRSKVEKTSVNQVRSVFFSCQKQKHTVLD